MFLIESMGTLLDRSELADGSQSVKVVVLPWFRQRLFQKIKQSHKCVISNKLIAADGKPMLGHS